MHHRRRAKLAALAALVVATAPVAASAFTARRPALRLMDAAPLTLRGTGFEARERVQVVVHAGARVSRRTTADLRGGFVVRFVGVDANACAGFAATAVGSQGSRATFKRAPGQCAAP